MFCLFSCRFWEYNKNRQLQSSGDLNKYFNSKEAENMDAMFVWQRNRRTYVFKGSKYWRYSKGAKKFDSGYPRNIKQAWDENFPSDISAAVSWLNDKSYIFKGDLYWRLKKDTTKIDVGYPKRIAEQWMKCNSNVAGLSVGSANEQPWFELSTPLQTTTLKNTESGRKKLCYTITSVNCYLENSFKY